MKHALSEAALPQGFRFSATACGLKKTGALDLALLSSDVPASAAAVFTKNLVVAAPVVVSKANLIASKGRMRGVIVNAGNANCATGDAGYAVSVKTVEETARRLRCHPRELFVCSTGVIGVPLPIERFFAPCLASFKTGAPRRARSRSYRSPSAPRTRAQRLLRFLSRWRASACTWWAAPRARG